MNERKKRKPIPYRVIAFVLAVALTFTSISFTDLGSVNVKAASDTSVGSDGVDTGADGATDADGADDPVSDDSAEPEVGADEYGIATVAQNATEEFDSLDGLTTHKAVYEKAKAQLGTNTLDTYKLNGAILSKDSDESIQYKNGKNEVEVNRLYKVYTATYTVHVFHNLNLTLNASTSGVSSDALKLYTNQKEALTEADRKYTVSQDAENENKYTYSIYEDYVANTEELFLEVPAVTGFVPAVAQITTDAAGKEEASVVLPVSNADANNGFYKYSLGKNDSSKTYTVTYEASSNAADFTASVSGTNKATGTVLVNGAAVGEGLSLAAGTQTIKVDPAQDCHVEKVTVNGQAITDVAYDADNNAVFELTTVAGEVYDIQAEFGCRMVKKETIGEIPANAYYKKGSTLASGSPAEYETLKNNIFQGVVSVDTTSGITYENVTIEYYVEQYTLYAAMWKGLDEVATAPVIGEYDYFSVEAGASNTIRITLPASADNKYPEIVVEANVTMKDSRLPYDFGQVTVADTVDVKNEWDVVYAAVKAQVPTEVRDIVTIAQKEGEVLPSAGEEKTVQVVVSISESSTYLANETTVTVPVKGTVLPSKIQVETVGDGTISGLTSGDSYFEGSYTITATPGNTSYVESIMLYVDDQAGVDITGQFNDSKNRSTTGTFNLENGGKTYKVVVTFKERSISLIAGHSVKLAVNGYNNSTIEASYVSEFTGKNVIEHLSFLDGEDVITGMTADDVVVLMQHKTNTGSLTYDTTSYVSTNVQYLLTKWQIFDAPPISKTIKVEWTGDNRYPTVSTADIFVQVVEARSAATISYEQNESYAVDTIEEVQTAEFYAKILSGLTVSEGAATPTVAYKSGVLAAEGASSLITYTVTVAGNENFVETTKDITVAVTNLKHYASIVMPTSDLYTVEVLDGEKQAVALTDGTEAATKVAVVDQGNFYIKVTPVTTAGYSSNYISDVRMNGAPLVTESNPAAFGTAYEWIVPLSVQTADKVDTTYAIAVETATRAIVSNDVPEGKEAYEVRYKENEWNDETKRAEFVKALLTSLVSTPIAADDVTLYLDVDGQWVVLSDATTEQVGTGVQTIKVVWSGQDQYPEVYKEFSVEFVEGRVTPVITVGEIEQPIVINKDFSEVTEAISDVISVTADRPYEVHIVGNPDVPKQGGTTTVNVKVSVQEDEAGDYLPAEKVIEDVEVAVAVKPAKVTIISDGNGTLSVVSGKGTEEERNIPNNGTCGTGTLTVTAAPTANNAFVASVAVNDGAMDMANQYFNTYVYENTYDVKDGTGEAADAPQHEYVFKAVFGERAVTLKEGLTAIPLTVNGYKTTLEVIKASYIEKVSGTYVIDSLAFSGGTATAEDLVVRMQYTTLNGPKFATPSEIASDWSTAWGASAFDVPPQVKPLQIEWIGDGVRYPSVTSAIITANITEQRTTAGLQTVTLSDYTDEDDNKFDTDEDLLAYVKANVSQFNPNNAAVEYKVTSAPTEGGKTELITVEVTHKEDQYYLADSCTVSFNATLAASKCAVQAGVDAELHGKITGLGVADGLSTVSITVKPNSGYAINEIKVTAENKVTGKTSNVKVKPEYTKGTAAFTFNTDGSNGSVTYTIDVTYLETSIALNNAAIIEYAYDMQDENGKPVVSGDELRKLVFNAVMDSATVLPSGLNIKASDLKNTEDKLPYINVEYNVDVLGFEYFKDVSADLLINIGGVTHKFGEDGTEEVRITYTDDRYGKIVSDVVTLTVFDARYNNTITVEEIDDEKGGSVTITPDSRTDHEENVLYMENTEHTITVKPGNSVLESGVVGLQEAAYVKSITVTDKAGNPVETSDIVFTEATSLTDSTAAVTFVTGRSQEYKVTVEYGVSTYSVVDGDCMVVRYDGVEDKYDAVIPSAESLFSAIIKEASPETFGVYDAEKVTVEYSTTGISYQSLDTITDVADGSKVWIKITYTDGSAQYRTIFATKQVTIKDPRTTTNITAVEAADLTEAIAYVEQSQLEANLREALQAEVYAGDSLLTKDASDVKFAISAITTEEDGKNYIDVTISYDGTAWDAETSTGYKPCEKTIKHIEVEDIPDVSTLQLATEDASGTVRVYIPGNDTAVASLTTEGVAVTGNTNYQYVITPVDGYIVDTVVLTKTDENGNTVPGQTLALTYEDRVAKTEVIYAQEKETYTFAVTYKPNVFSFAENPVFECKPGWEDLTAIDRLEDLYNAAVVSPALSGATELSEDEYDFAVKYLAREAGKYDFYMPALVVPYINYTIPGTGQNYQIDMKELWLIPGEEVHNVTADQLLDELEKEFAKVTDLQSALQFTSYLTEFINSLSTASIGAHEFGLSEDGTERICVGFDNEKYAINLKEDGTLAAESSAETVSTVVTILDSRIDTSVAGADATVTYGATADEVYEALGLGVKDESGNLVDGLKVEFLSKVEGLDVSENTYEIQVSFAGNEEYQPCKASFNLTVVKAPCTIEYETQVVKYGSDYSFELTKNPEDVDVIELVIGLDAKDMAVDNLKPNGYIQLRLPGALGNLFDADMSLSDFITALEGLASLSESVLTGLGLDAETIETIVNVLNSVVGALDGAGDITVKFNGDSITPTDVGVYLAGAVTADSNYETDYALGFLVVYPDGVEAEVDWRFEDSNGIISKNLIEDGLYDLGADGFVDGELNDGATDAVKHLFLRMDADGNFKLIYAKNNEAIADSVDELTKTGGYVQMAMALDWGNQLYYSQPIIRAYAVVPQLLNVHFVDADGNPARTFETVYDGQHKALNVVVSDNYGHVFEADELEEFFQIKYYGYTLKNPLEIYESTTAPKDAGVYTAVASFVDKEGGRYGADIAALQIKSQEIGLTVDNQVVTYGDEYDLGIKCTSDDCDYISIVAGIDAGGDISSEKLNPVSGMINIDFPENMDKILEIYMPEAYTIGISANEMINRLGDMTELLTDFGFSENTVTTIQSILDMIPESELGEYKVTYKDNVVPKNTGLYVVGAVTCDANYTFAADAGYLMVSPDSYNTKLAFNYTDDNHIFTLHDIQSGELDLGSHVVVAGDFTEEMALEAEKQLVNIYIGVGLDGKIAVSNEPIEAYGAYTQLAYLEVNNLNQFYYAEPIIRGYLIVAETVDVQFVDESGNVNPDRMFTHDGQPKEMPVKVTYNGEDLSDSDALTVTYLGYDAKGVQIYNSTTPPTNVGVYSVVAVYADKEEELYGATVGAMTIRPCPDVSIEVKDQSVAVGDDYDLGITVTPEGLDYISVVAGIAVGDTTITDIVDKAECVVNVDLPTYIDEVLRPLIPDAYENGITGNELVSLLETLVDNLKDYGISDNTVEQLKDILSQIPVTNIGNQVVTLKDNYVPREMGVYVVGAVLCDVNYYPCADLGYLVVGEYVDVQFLDNAGNKVNTQNFVYNGQPQGMYAQAVDKEGTVLSNDTLTVTYLGFDVKGLQIYNSTEAPVNVGGYTVLAVYYDVENGYVGINAGAMSITQAESSVVVENQKVSVNTEYDLAVTVTPQDCDYITIVAGVTASNGLLDRPQASQGSVNVDLPEYIDAILKEEAPEIYEADATLQDLLDVLNRLVTDYAEEGISYSAVKAIKDVIAQVQAADIAEMKMTFIDGYKPTEMGAYAVAAITCDANYKVSADLGYLLIGDVVDVQFVDADGTVNNKQSVVYNGQPQGMDVQVTTSEGKVLDKARALTVNYIGYDAKGIEIYNSTTPPTNVGVYTATAVYYDKLGGYVGLGVGVLTITQADASISVENQVVSVGDTYDLGITVNPEACGYISVVTGLDAGESDLSDITNTVKGVVNIDFPQRVDNALKDIIPEAYEDGITVNELIDKLGTLANQLEQYGISADVIAQIQRVIDQIPTTELGNQSVTFLDDYVPTAMGAYAVAAITCDVNYKAAADIGYLLIGEAVDVKIGTQTFTYNGQPQGVNVEVVREDGTVIGGTDDVTLLYLGYDAKGIEIYHSATPPTNVGVYTVIALYCDSKAGYVGLGTGLMTIEQAPVSITVENQIAKVGSDYQIKVVVDPQDCEYATIVAGINVKGGNLTDITNTVAGVVNIDFPESIDKVLKKYVPDIYKDGTTVNEMLAELNDAAADLAEYGLPESFVKKIQDALAEIPVTDLGNQRITFQDGFAPKEMGAYAVLAVTCDVNYKVAADFGYLLVGDTAEVQFLDADGNVTDYTSFAYNGQPQSMGMKVVTSDGTELTNMDALSVYYIGYDAKGIEFYHGTEAPVNAGMYVQSALFFDATAGYVGVGVGTFAIGQGAASINVKNQNVIMGTEYDLGITVNPENCDYISIVAGVSVDNQNMSDVTEAMETVVNVDFPENIDKVLKKIMPEEFENGMTINEMIEKLNQIPEELKELGVPSSITDEIQKLVAQIPVTDIGNQRVTFQDGYVPKQMGIYAVAGVTCDVNYKIVADIGYLVVGQTVDIEFVDADGVKTTNVVYTYDGQPHGLNAVVTAKDGTDLSNSENLTVRYIGADAGGLNVYNSTEAPKNAGVYTVTALYYDATTGQVGVGVAIVAIKARDIEIKIHNQEKLVGGVDPNFTYEVKAGSELVEGDALILAFEREEGEAAGEYVISTSLIDFARNMNYNIIAEEGILTIKERDIVVTLDDITVGYGEKPEPTYQIDYQYALVPDTLKDIIVLYDISYEKDGISYVDPTAVGEYTITAKVAFVDGKNPIVDMGYADIYNASVVNGKLTITEKTISDVNVIGYNDVIYNGSEQTFDNLMVIDDNYVLTEGTDYTVAYDNNISVGTASITITGVGNYKGTKTVNFAIKEADNAWTEQLSILGWIYGEYDPAVNRPSASSAVVDADVTYEYFADKDCTKTLNEAIGQSVPGASTPVGTYYVRAIASDTENYKVLVSDAVAFSVTPKSIRGAEVTISEDDFTYTGTEQIPSEVVVKVNGKSLTENVDYSISYANNVNAGTAVVTIVGKGNYVDVVKGTYEIEKVNLENATIVGLDTQTQTYDGTAKTPVPSVQLNGATLAKNNYEVSYSNNVNAGTNTAQVTVTAVGNSNYTGSVTAQFSILKATNTWTSALRMSGWEYGKYNEEENRPYADALYGDVAYTFYTDAALTDEFTPSASTPAGIYYVKAEVEAENVYGNYTGLVTSKLFTVSKAYLPTPTLEYTSVVYDGTEKTPEVTLAGVESEAYEVSYSENVEVGTAIVTVRASNNSSYYGSHTLVFKIDSLNVANAEVTINDLAEKTYTGTAITQPESAFVVTVDGQTLTYGTDYTVSYENNVNVGTAIAKITFTGNYAGAVTKNFKIVPAELSDAVLEYVSVPYDGMQKHPNVMIEGLTEDVDFTVSYEDGCVEIGSYTATITAVEGSNYKGTVTRTFTITSKDISDASVTVADLIYTGTAVRHNVNDGEQLKVVVDGRVLDPRTDYYVSYSNNTEAGVNTAIATIIGSGNYTGRVATRFSICTAQNAWKQEINLTVDEWEYGTTPATPVAKAKFGIVSYEYFKDAECVYSMPRPTDKTAAGTYYVRARIEATEAYTGLVGEAIAFTICPKELSAAAVTVSGEDKVYDGTEQSLNDNDIKVIEKATRTKLVYGTDFEITGYANNVNAGSATVYVKGKGNYAGEWSGTFEITQATNSWKNAVAISGWTYGETANRPYASAMFGSDTITYKYFSDKNCRNELENIPTEAGTYYVKAYVAETDNYTGLETKTKDAASFQILPRAVASVVLEYTKTVYDGTAKKPGVTVKGFNGEELVEGTDYTVVYADNKEVGSASVTVMGVGNYKGETVLNFSITPIELTSTSITGIENKVYTGSEITQEIQVVIDGKTLVLGQDYKVEYLGGTNVNVGTALMYVVGLNHYQGEVLKAFQILPAKLTEATLAYTTVEADGTAKTPSAVVKSGEKELVYGIDYYVTYTNNVKAGTATATFIGIGNYANSRLQKEFVITNPNVIVPEYNLTDAVLEYTSVVYDGTVKTPSVIVKDGDSVVTLETDYIVSYKNNLNAGTATVMIKGIGKYKGELIEKTFQIEKADNAWTKALAITGWTYGEYNDILNAPSATAVSGSAVYEYFKVVTGADGNASMVALDKVPTEVGLYLVKATVAESANYKALVSEYVDFEISHKSLVDDNVKVEGLVDKTYTGSEQVQEGLKVTVGGKELVVGKDITVSYENNINAGEATVTIKAAPGSGYTESKVCHFNIDAVQLPKAVLAYTEVTADGTVKKPTVSVEGLKEGVDFTVAYTENVEVGTAIVAVTGIGNYEGVQVLTFKITAPEIPAAMYTVTFDTVGGSQIAPITVEEGTQIDLPAAPVREKAQFRGWTLNSDSEEVQYQPGDKMTVTGNVTVYAVWELDQVVQVYGGTRYDTAIGIAEQIKKELNVEKFDTIIVATGETFVDALSGSYLSYVKNAPILLINGQKASSVTSYINKNLATGGKVYVLGGEAAVKDAWISGIATSNVKRLKGKTRYETNIAILNEAGVTSGEILVATGKTFADSLSAASAKKPIFLVQGDSLNAAQKSFLSSMKNDFYSIIGGEAAVSEKMQKAIGAYGTVIRVKGKDRYGTSLAVAERYVANPRSIVVTDGKNFPDGLCGGLLAIVTDSPVILSSNDNAGSTAAYIARHGITDGYVLGGSACFKDESIAKMFAIKSDDILKLRYPDALR